MQETVLLVHTIAQKLYLNLPHIDIQIIYPTRKLYKEKRHTDFNIVTSSLIFNIPPIISYHYPTLSDFLNDKRQICHHNTRSFKPTHLKAINLIIKINILLSTLLLSYFSYDHASNSKLFPWIFQKALSKMKDNLSFLKVPIVIFERLCIIFISYTNFKYYNFANEQEIVH